MKTWKQMLLYFDRNSPDQVAEYVINDRNIPWHSTRSSELVFNDTELFAASIRD